jgi:DNA topoisomerase II
VDSDLQMLASTVGMKKKKKAGVLVTRKSLGGGRDGDDDYRPVKVPPRKKAAPSRPTKANPRKIESDSDIEMTGVEKTADDKGKAKPASKKNLYDDSDFNDPPACKKPVARKRQVKSDPDVEMEDAGKMAGDKGKAKSPKRKR